MEFKITDDLVKEIIDYEYMISHIDGPLDSPCISYKEDSANNGLLIEYLIDSRQSKNEPIINNPNFKIINLYVWNIYDHPTVINHMKQKARQKQLESILR